MHFSSGDIIVVYVPFLQKRQIPNFHMELGTVVLTKEFDNRKIVDHVSDINLTYSDIAREYLLRGLPADRIIKTGSPMFEVLIITCYRIF
jgi:UDP-N-acetylglucosamine 2-epimerase (non-hydrolysing)